MFSEKRMLSLAEVCKTTGICRTSVYAAMKRGDLRAVKYGTRTFVRIEDLNRFLDSMPTYEAAVDAPADLLKKR